VRRLQPSADYLCLNLSCPNTRDGRGFFHDRSRLTALLQALDDVGASRDRSSSRSHRSRRRASWSRFSPPSRRRVCVSGFSVNLPPGKPRGLATASSTIEQMPGAVSGRPAAAAADGLLAALHRRMDRRRYRLIGSGGVFDAADAYRKIRLGASLVQLLTALVYEGPAVVAAINCGLARRLEADGFRHVADAVGIDAN
jgi:dihydroorotate dehydrogenase (fumarate)/dihydroorotate dehydrogenase